MKPNEVLYLDYQLSLRCHPDSSQAMEQLSEGKFTILSDFCYKVNDKVIKAFFDDPILRKAFVIALPHIRTKLWAKY